MTPLEELKRIATDGVFDQRRDSALVEEALPDLVRAVEALERIERGDFGLTGPAVELAREVLAPFVPEEKP